MEKKENPSQEGFSSPVPLLFLSQDVRNGVGDACLIFLLGTEEVLL